MIQVQIASALERGGVSGLRWVLVDASEPRRESGAAAHAAAAVRAETSLAVPDSGSPVRRATLGVHVACAAVLLFALTAAWWVSSAMHGSPPITSARHVPPAR
jgi:hypothetical protein